MCDTCSIVLAAGEGTRMKSNHPKVLAKVLFEPMLKWVLDSLEDAKITEVCVVTGYKSNLVKNFLNSLPRKYNIIEQTERKGTAHAVLTAQDFLQDNINKDVLIINGDSPFLNAETIKKAYNLHKNLNNAATVISAKVKDAYGYGRIIRTEKNNKLMAIVEEKDANEKIKKISEVNSGAYWFNIKALLKILCEIKNDNAQREFYLPDAIKLLLNLGYNINVYTSESEEIIMGANNREQLLKLNTIAKMKVLQKLMSDGVDILSTEGVIIAKNVRIGRDTTILPGSIIYGETIIGTGCTIGPNSFIKDCLIGNNIKLNSVNFQNSKILNNDIKIKPFSVVKNNEFV